MKLGRHAVPKFQYTLMAFKNLAIFNKTVITYLNAKISVPIMTFEYGQFL